MGRKNQKGRYIKKVGHLDIRAKDSHTRGKSRGKFSKDPVSGTELVIYHAKKQLEGGFKSISEAEAKCKELLGKEYCETYNL